VESDAAMTPSPLGEEVKCMTKAYGAPTVTVFGRLAEITLGGSGPAIDFTADPADIAGTIAVDTGNPTCTPIVPNPIGCIHGKS